MADARSYRCLFWGLAAAGLALDLASKYYVFDWLKPGERREYVQGVFSIVHQDHLNDGALWGMGGTGKHRHGGVADSLAIFHDEASTSNRVFAGFSVVAIIVILICALHPSTRGDLLLNIALGLILAGAIGNLYDRVVFGGVRDFIWFYWEPNYPRGFPVFNIADSCLVCGAGLLLLQSIVSQRAAATQPAAEPAGVTETAA